MKKISMFVAMLAAGQLCATDGPNEYYTGELKAYCSPLSLVSILHHFCTTNNQGQIASSLKTVLHEQQKSIDQITLPYGNVLHIAARTSGKILQFFLSHFSDESASMIAALNEDGQTPLLDAVFFEEIENAEILLSFIKEKSNN